MSIAIGVKTKTHVFVCSETVLGESVVKVKEDEERTVRIGDVLLSVGGRQADALRLRLYGTEASRHTALRYRIPITPGLVCNVVRRRVHGALRSQPLQCNAIVGGAGPGCAPELHVVDGHGAAHSDNFVVTGYGLYFLYGIYDMYYAEDMGLEETRHFIMHCLKALQERLVVETNRWSLDIIGTDGVKTKEEIQI